MTKNKDLKNKKLLLLKLIHKITKKLSTFLKAKLI
jgi:hypothetical protein